MDIGRFESFGAICHKNDGILILGTMPSPVSIKQNFYYAHPQNRFWKMLAELFNEAVPDSVEQKQSLLERHRIALWDVLAECERKGADDSTITREHVNDIQGLIENNPDIRLIACNGAKAYELYQKYFKGKIDIPVHKMPSTSSANAACSFEKLRDAWSAILTWENENENETDIVEC